MAKVGNNVLTHGLHGKIGDLIVFRVRNGETIVGAKPEHAGPPTEAMLKHRELFQEAVLYAKSAMADPDKKAAYDAAKKPGESAYNVAVADFLKAPHIEEIDVSLYAGQPGDKIRVRAVDDFKVAEVTVTVDAADGTPIESGSAVQNTNGLDWTYTATTANTAPNGCKIVVRVSDVPGKLVETTQTL
jgi:hypothetical protein